MRIIEPTTLCDTDLGEVEIEGTNVTIENCKISRLYALRSLVIVRHCQGRNVGRNFVQLDKCLPGSLVEWCEVINEPGKTKVEDDINLFQTQGAVVRNNYVEGATPRPDYSGSGIMIDRRCRNCRVIGNVVVNTQNAGIGIAGGRNNRAEQNRVLSVGPGCNGNVGIYISNRYPQDRFEDNSGRGNVIQWVTGKGRNDWWIETGDWLKDNQHGKGMTRDDEYKAWQSRRDEATQGHQG